MDDLFPWTSTLHVIMGGGHPLLEQFTSNIPSLVSFSSSSTIGGQRYTSLSSVSFLTSKWGQSNIMEENKTNVVVYMLQTTTRTGHVNGNVVHPCQELIFPVCGIYLPAARMSIVKEYELPSHTHV